MQPVSASASVQWPIAKPSGGGGGSLIAGLRPAARRAGLRRLRRLRRRVWQLAQK